MMTTSTTVRSTMGVLIRWNTGLEYVLDYWNGILERPLTLCLNAALPNKCIERLRRLTQWNVSYQHTMRTR